MQVMNERDTRNIIKTAERVGREEERLESARRMLKENLPVELVAKCSNLTVQEVKDLLQAAS